MQEGGKSMKWIDSLEQTCFTHKSIVEEHIILGICIVQKVVLEELIKWHPYLTLYTKLNSDWIWEERKKQIQLEENSKYSSNCW